MTFLFVIYPSILYRWWFLSVLLSVALLLHSFAFYGIWRDYRSRIGAGAFAIGLIAALFVLTTGVVASAPCGTTLVECYRGIPPSTLLLFVASLVLLGIAAIAEGATFLTIRRFTRTQETYAAGVLCVVAGALLVSVLFAFFGGFFVLSIALTFGGIVVRKGPIFPLAVPLGQGVQSA